MVATSTRRRDCDQPCFAKIDFADERRTVAAYPSICGTTLAGRGGTVRPALATSSTASQN